MNQHNPDSAGLPEDPNRADDPDMPGNPERPEFPQEDQGTTPPAPGAEDPVHVDPDIAMDEQDQGNAERME